MFILRTASIPPTFDADMALLLCKSRAALVYFFLLASSFIEISRSCEGIFLDHIVCVAYVHAVDNTGLCRSIFTDPSFDRKKFNENC